MVSMVIAIRLGIGINTVINSVVNTTSTTSLYLSIAIMGSYEVAHDRLYIID